MDNITKTNAVDAMNITVAPSPKNDVAMQMIWTALSHLSKGEVAQVGQWCIEKCIMWQKEIGKV